MFTYSCLRRMILLEENLPPEKFLKIDCPSFLPIGTFEFEINIMKFPLKWQQVIEQNGAQLN